MGKVSSDYNPRMDLRVTAKRGGDDFAVVQKGLGDYNAANGLEGAAVPINVYLRDGEELLGGLCGETAEDRLWVGQLRRAVKKLTPVRQAE